MKYLELNATTLIATSTEFFIGMRLNRYLNSLIMKDYFFLYSVKIIKLVL